MQKLLLLLFLFTAYLAQAQGSDEKVLIKGQVVSEETNEPVSFVHIINQSTHQGLTTNDQGEFKFNINPSDTIVFSAVGYDRYYLTLNDMVQDDEISLKISFQTSVTELNEVEVFSYKDAEALKKAILAFELPDNQEKIVVPGSYDGPRREYKPSVLNPVSFAFSMFDKKAKERVKLVQVQQQTEQWKQLRKKYDFIKEIAGIEEEELEEFLEFCHLDIRQIEFSTDYELAVAVNRCLPDFKDAKNK